MIIPALFVADSVNRAAGSARPFDTLVLTGPSDVSKVHRQWTSEHGIELRDDLDVSPVGDIPMLQERLSAATLMKLLLPGFLADRYDMILYLDSDLTIHDDVSSIFALDTGNFPLAAVPSARVWEGRSKAERQWTEEHFRALGMTPPYRFFNTGVLLIDVGKWNREGLGNRTLNFIRQNPDLCFSPTSTG
jgi:lipopolysaccharide biosynthesis glycosyltransferase